jgi:3(or 17)beta-hydroxysteroid dehydrogenase
MNLITSLGNSPNKRNSMTNDRLKDKVSIVTGAANGIGLQTLELFRYQGASVIAIDILPPSNEFSNKFGTYGDIDYLQLDISLEKSWIQILDYIRSKYDRLDILVNNAGINGYDKLQDPEHMTLDTWHYIHSINLDSVFLGCKYAINIMKNANHSKVSGSSCSIINIASRSGIVGVPNLAAYASSKAAIRNYTKSVAAYCTEKGYDIRCNTISPASIDTQMWDNLRTDKVAFERFCRTLPLKRIGKPEEVAHACLYLASDDASYTTGSEIIVDGGILSTCGSLPK